MSNKVKVANSDVVSIEILKYLHNYGEKLDKSIAYPNSTIIKRNYLN